MEKLGWNYIVIEGNIGAGKTTLATMLSQHYDARLMLEQFSDNPFLPGFYENPAKYAFPLELSFLAERYQHLKAELLQRDLFNPRLVADYFVLKSLVFAQINLPEAEFQLFERLFQIIRDHMPMPDKIVYLHSEQGRLRQNIEKRGRTFEQNISDAYLDSLQKGYFELLKSLKQVPVAVVDVSHRDFVSDQEAFEHLRALAEKPLTAGMHFFEI
jgi:deoxyguanosine kinase